MRLHLQTVEQGYWFPCTTNPGAFFCLNDDNCCSGGKVHFSCWLVTVHNLAPWKRQWGTPILLNMAQDKVTYLPTAQQISDLGNGCAQEVAHHASVYALSLTLSLTLYELAWESLRSQFIRRNAI